MVNPGVVMGDLFWHGTAAGVGVSQVKLFWEPQRKDRAACAKPRVPARVRQRYRGMGRAPPVSPAFSKVALFPQGRPPKHVQQMDAGEIIMIILEVNSKFWTNSSCSLS